MKETDIILAQLKSQQNADNVSGMKRYGIEVRDALGVPLPFMHTLAKQYRNNHALALELWNAGFHETRMMATMVDNPAEVTAEQMDLWIQDFDSWDICDGCCSNLFRKTPFAKDKAIEWTSREAEYEKRAGFVLMACLAVHSKTLNDEVFTSFLSIIVHQSGDSRNFVRKAVNWSLRQIGKRNQCLYNNALLLCQALIQSPNKTAHWIGNDAYRELLCKKAQERMIIKDAKLKKYHLKDIHKSK